MATKAYLALGKDGYDVFRDANMLMDSECAPLIPNLVRNHFSALAALNQLSKKRPALVDRVIMRLKSQGSREEGGEAEAGDVPYKVAPRLEGRIVRIVDQAQPDA